MKTKSFLLATAGSTVDGRKIDEKMIEEMASSYDPQTYGSRVNIEHITGIAPDGPFRAHGDLLELSVGEVDVNFNGNTEKRKALFGVFDVTDEAKKLNEAGQKVYPSIEIEPNFGGKGFAYCMGVALTDRPASIATEKMHFNRQLPGTIKLSRDEPIAFELAEETESGAGLIASFGTMLDNFAAKFAPKQDAKAQQSQQANDGDGNAAPSLDFAAFRSLFEDFGKSIEAQFSKVGDRLEESDQRFARLTKQLEEAPANNFTRRPKADGTKTDGEIIY